MALKKQAARIPIWEELNKLRKKLIGEVDGKLTKENEHKNEAKRIKNDLADELHGKDSKK